MPPERRAEIASALAEAGVPEVEVAAFVSPRAVPAMGGAGDVMAALELRTATQWWALVPNCRGAGSAYEAGARHLTVTVAASEGYAARNTNRTVAESVSELGKIIEQLPDGEIDAVISCCFGSPFDDVESASSVYRVVEQVLDVGPARLTLADTTGTASPRRIRELIDLTGPDVGLHLHDTRGTALANALSALELGVRRFDTAIGGLGGSPFAPGSGGNLATEDLVMILDDLGVRTGVDLDRILAVSHDVGLLLGRQLPSRAARAGRLSAYG